MEFKQTITAPHDREVRYFKAPVYLTAIQKGRDAIPRMLEKLGDPLEWRYTLEARWYSSPRVAGGEIRKRWSLVETYGHDSIIRH